MSLTNLNLPFMWDVSLRNDGSPPGFDTSLLLDASTEKAAFVGQVWHPSTKTGTINIRKVHFRLGAVTFNAASVFRVSLQNVSATAGPPYQPDGSQDQTADMTSLSANAMNATGNLSADRAVDLSADSLGDANSRWLAVVFEYQTFTAADSVVVNSWNPGIRADANLGGHSLLNTGSWAMPALSIIGNVVLECDDGTFAFLDNTGCFSAASSASVSSTAAIRRAGVKFQVPVETKIEGFGLMGLFPNGSDGRLVLYDSDGSTELASVDVDNDAVSIAAQARAVRAMFAPVTLSAATNYRIAYVGGTATASTIYNVDVGAAGHMDGLMLGQNAHWTQHDGASWTDTTTRRPVFGLKLSAVHDGTGGGGGGGQRVIGG
jgi:hypothetical protein